MRVAAFAAFLSATLLAAWGCGGDEPAADDAATRAKPKRPTTSKGGSGGKSGAGGTRSNTGGASGKGGAGGKAGSATGGSATKGGSAGNGNCGTLTFAGECKGFGAAKLVESLGT